jgi:hypothetical protein
MKFKFLLGIFLLFSLLLTACAPKSTASASPLESASAYPTTGSPTDAVTPGIVTPAATAQGNNQENSTENFTRSDQQGNVVVDVTPESLSPTGDTFVFDVNMNTHMVNLDMDLAKLSTLSTDDGRSVTPTRWDVPEGGGHHVSGKLVFPVKRDGKPLLEGAIRLTLIIKHVDADIRLFNWQLAK